MDKTIELARKYTLLAQELDEAGWTIEASIIDAEIALAKKQGLFGPSKNVRMAIRGQSTWDDYLENILTGAGSGAAGTAMTGVGAPLAGWGALLGGAVGAGQTAINDVFFNKFYGQTAKAEKLIGDLFGLSEQMAGTVAQYTPQYARQIYALANQLKAKISLIRENKRKEISERHGLDPNKGFLQSLMNPMGALRRRWDLAKASTDNERMVRAADGPGDIIGGEDVSPLLTRMKQPWAKTDLGVLTGKRVPLTGGQVAGGMIGGLAGGLATNMAYNAIANKIRGPIGILQKQINDVQQIGQVTSQLLQDPSIAQIAQQIARLGQTAIQAMQAGQQPTYQRGQIDYTQPANQYTNQQQTFR